MLNNAAKFTNRGGRIWLSLEKQGQEAVLTVRDNGIGIPAEVMPRVFEPFTQADVTPARERGGLGIGLSLVKQLVELHGGSVQAASEGPGRGATFTVRLPLASEAEVRSRALPNESAGQQAVKPRRVLVVDDQEDVADSFATLLRLSGHDVRVAPDGPAALSLAASFQPQFVVLDIGLPGMDGYEVARQLRKHSGAGSMRIVALSGYGREEDARLSREVGIEAHFVKPVDPAIIEELMATEHAG
jgi:CheY-like chemotaxis protein